MARDDTPIRRYSRPQNPLMVPLVAGGIILGLLILIATVSLVMVLKSGDVSAGRSGSVPLIPILPPSAEREGLTWEPKMLAEHLRAKGVITQYEVEEPQQAAFVKDHGGIKAVTSNGGKVWIKKHAGAISADDFAKYWSRSEIAQDQQSYQWGAFTCCSWAGTGDSATGVFGQLPGVKKFVRGRLID